MIRDRYLRLVFIPLLGFMIPVVSGIITYHFYSPFGLLLANGWFILTSYLIWSGCHWVHMKIRPLHKIGYSPFLKIASVSFTSALYGSSIGVMCTLIWYKFSRETYAWMPVLKFVLFTSLAVIVFTLVYEILFLSKERELDTKIVDQLDKERTQAELTILYNELDPHFIFNSLNTLSYLIRTNPPKAHLFNNRLASVYKYFLINKERELIPLHDELEFIQNYMFLLRIRHDDKLSLTSEVDQDTEEQMKIPPCALQVLVENAIKHNEFTDESPLEIRIVLNGHFLKVSNNTRPKMHQVNSTGIGLRNLSSRYRLICQKEIVIDKSDQQFTVKLPIIP